MKCKACNATLKESEQRLDVRTGTLEVMCNICIQEGMTDREFTRLYPSSDDSSISDMGLGKGDADGAD